MYYVYNGFYVFDFIAHCWATFSALCALSSRIMTNKDDDDDVTFSSVDANNAAVRTATDTIKSSHSRPIFRVEM